MQLMALLALAGAAWAGSFVLFSDFHVDPWYGQPGGLCTRGAALGAFGCDSPWSLAQCMWP